MRWICWSDPSSYACWQVLRYATEQARKGRQSSGLHSPLIEHMLLVDVQGSDALHDAWHLGGVDWLASHPTLEERIARIYGQEQDALPLQEEAQRWVNPFAAALPLAEPKA